MTDTTSAPAGAGAGDEAARIHDLRVVFDTDAGEVTAVDGVDLELRRGEVLAIVGESGSGKTVTARTLLGLIPATAQVRGEALLRTREGDADVTELRGEALRRLRGPEIAMVFQEPSTALNPVFTVGWQLAEGLRAHRRLTRAEARTEAVAMLERVGIPDAEHRVDAYPHEFSGGQKQRIVIAMALALGSRVLVADEPTTALDVTVQAEILDLLRGIKDEFGTAIVVITHNMGVVADLADRVAVMYLGRVVEQAPMRELFASPKHEYTQRLLAAVPRIDVDTAPPRREAVAGAAPVVRARGLEVTYPGRLGKKAFRAVRGVDFEVAPGEVLGLVGESGSGKSTIGRAIAGLAHVTGGELDVAASRRELGFVFQDPATSFNPLLTIGECVAEPLVVHGEARDAAAARGRVGELLEAVQLPAEFAARFPHELSGGQRQRASLARALALDPKLLIADEPTSALDVSVQARVLELFAQLQQRLGFACLFISHDLAVVRAVSHRVAVLYQGELVEIGDTDAVLDRPQHDYTQRLLGSLPVPDPVLQARRRAELRAQRERSTA